MCGCECRLDCGHRWIADNRVRAYGVCDNRLLLSDYRTQHFVWMLTVVKLESGVI
jgi:hypothetical protein